MVQRFKAAFNGQNTMRSATTLLVVTLFLSNILGFLRDRFLASKIPAAQADMYFNAFRLPDLVFNVLILGAVTSAFIPVFTEYLGEKHSSKEAWRLANATINMAIIALAIILGILVLLLPILIPLISPFKEPERIAGTVHLARLLMIQPFFFGLSYIAGSMLNSLKRFVAYSIAPLIYNMAIIFGIVYLSPHVGVMGVVYGVLIGALLHFLIQAPSLWTLGYRYQFVIDFKSPAIRKMIRLMGPRTLQLLLLQLVEVSFGRIAASLAVGSVSSLNYANNIQTVPTVVFGNAFAMASFPYLSQAFNDQKDDHFQHYLIRSAKAALFFLLPSAVGIYMLRLQIVRLILGTGNFGWDQTLMTGQVLGMYAIGLTAVGLIPLYSRAFFATHDTKTPMLITIPISILAVALGYYLAEVQHMNVAGLALASSISALTQIIVLHSLLKVRVTVEAQRDLWMSAGTYLLLSLVMAAAIQVVSNYIGSATDLRYAKNVLLQGGLGLIVGAVVYLGLALVLRIEEVEFLWKKKKIFTAN